MKRYTIIQSNFGYGWDDEIKYDESNSEEMKEFKRDIRDYRSNALENGYAVRVVRRRETDN